MNYKVELKGEDGKVFYTCEVEADNKDQAMGSALVKQDSESEDLFNGCEITAIEIK